MTNSRITAVDTMNLQDQAEAFAVWRVGTQQDWKCSYLDIADQTGIPTWRVLIICLNKNWRCHEPMPSHHENCHAQSDFCIDVASKHF